MGGAEVRDRKLGLILSDTSVSFQILSLCDSCHSVFPLSNESVLSLRGKWLAGRLNLSEF